MKYNPNSDINFLFVQNKYSKWYFNIIQTALTFNQTRKARNIYVENHHIFPTKLGGPNVPENKVFLSAREHFICHLLLTKMLNGSDHSKMIFAAFSMKLWKKHNIFVKINSRLFENLRIKHSNLMSSSQRGRIISEEHRKKLSIANLGKTASLETKKKMSIALKGQKRSQETRDKMKVSNKRPHTLETKQKISRANKGHKTSDETKQKLSIAAKGKPRPRGMYTEHWKHTQQISHLGRKDTPETFLKKSQAQAGKNNPRSLTWIIQKEIDGSTIEIKSLKPWCKQLNINNDTLTSTLCNGKFYKGYKVLERY